MHCLICVSAQLIPSLHKKYNIKRNIYDNEIYIYILASRYYTRWEISCNSRSYFIRFFKHFEHFWYKENTVSSGNRHALHCNVFVSCCNVNSLAFISIEFVKNRMKKSSKLLKSLVVNLMISSKINFCCPVNVTVTQRLKL